jgi:hypothetical protein
VSVVAFERDSNLEGIWESGFRKSQLRSIAVPTSAVVLRKNIFYNCRSLESVTFESGSRLKRIEKSPFQWSGLISIEISSSVVVFGDESFSDCWSLESVRFRSGSRFEQTVLSSWQFGSRSDWGLAWLEGDAFSNRP